jgi:predicted ATPase/signal transduction histidine kinase
MLTLPSYQIGTQIYESANSLVYRGVRKKDNQPVILKMLKPDYPTPAELTRYRQEYEITHDLDLAGVIKAYRLEKYQNTLVIVFQDFGAESLKQFMANRPLTVEAFLPFAIQIADSLGNIHAANLIHKDINPSNIVVNHETKQLKIIDFGIASRLPRENPTLKNPEQLEGTLAYLSPEQTGRINRSLDYRTDLYSLGVTCYEMLTGQLPFTATDAMELVHCHLAKTPAPVCEINSNVPQMISDIVMKLMAKNVEDRYQSAFGVKADLEKCLALTKKRFGNPLFSTHFQLAQNDFSGKLQIPQKLYGRDSQVKTLLQAFERVSEGAAEMMLVAGYSGVGKTALVREVHKPMTEKRGYFAAGKFEQYQRNIPYSALTQAFSQLFYYMLTESTAQLLKWRSKILNAVGNNGQVLIDVIPQLELVIGKQPAVAQVGATEAQNRFNLVFQNFFRAISQAEHPLILFIDDLQWADSASLNLLNTLMTDTENQYFLMIGAYRDNEVDATHPLMITVDDIQKAGGNVNTLLLQNLSQNDVNRLIAEALMCQDAYAEPLTQLVYEKTQGNAFFTHELLKSLYAQSLLVFEVQTQTWQWQVDKIAALNMTSNVVELMMGSISQLPADTLEMVKLAACIGNSFELKTLSLIGLKSPADTLGHLWSAIEEGLLLPLDDNYKQPDSDDITAHFKFQHDRIQQAAYSLIEPAKKPAIHLTIGRLLLANTKPSDLDEKLFEVVNQLNEGMALIDDETERLQLAELNLRSGQKAKAATAYQPASNYLKTGMSLLHHEAWQPHYDLNLVLHNEAAEAAYLSGDFEQTHRLIEIILQNAKTKLDKVKAYETKIQSSIAQNHMPAAIETGLQVVEMLGVSLSQSPPQQIVIEELYNLPAMTALDKQAVMRILVLIFPPALIANPSLLPNMAFTMVNLCIKYGNSPLAAFAYVFYGMLLSGMLGNGELGYQFGKLALKMSEKFNARSIECIVTNLFNALIRHWKEPARHTILSLRENIQVGLEIGNIEWTGYTALSYCTNLFLIGEPLESVLKQQKSYFGLLAQLKQEFQLPYAKVWEQLVLNLTSSHTTTHRLSGELFNEAEMLPFFQQTNNFSSLFATYFAKTFLSYLFKDYADAVACANLTSNYEQAMTGFLVVAYHNFYSSLAFLAQYPNAESTEKAEYLEKVVTQQQQLKIWVNSAPMNYQHKYDLVEAEKARVFGQNWKAAALYEKAIAGAKENEYLHEETLAYELAAEFYLARGMAKIAQTYMKEAHYRYQQWGAVAKVKDLEERYPQWLAQKSTSAMPTMLTSTSTSTIMATAGTRRITASSALDLESVMKAAQTLSGEMVLSLLLEKMMHIVIENAGAQRGFLILPDDDKWVIEAEGAIDKKEVTVLHSLPVSHHLPEAIINYVARTQENVVLTDARREGLYTENPYIKAHQTQSVLCFPIVYQLKLRAILYLENNLTTGAFTPQRLNVLKMLSSQIAISLENAQWVSTLDAKVAERTAQLNAKVEELIQTRQELVQSEKMASLGRLVAGFAHELNTPLGVAVGTASTLQENVDMINRLLEQEEVDEEELLAYLETVDKAATLTLSNLRRAANLVTSFKRTAVDQTSDDVRTFHVHEVINDTINTLHNRFKKNGIDIQLDCSNHLKIKSLPGALEQILTNLLINSLIHGFNEGKNAGLIKINVQLNENHLQLEYSDNGKGIAQENLAKIFEPFFTTHRAHGGSGLGMYICYNLVTTQLQGTISCESRLGKGVVFQIDYPIDVQS